MKSLFIPAIFFPPLPSSIYQGVKLRWAEKKPLLHNIQFYEALYFIWGKNFQKGRFAYEGLSALLAKG